MIEQRTATALLDAAESALARHGVDDMSLRAIMREAGANPAAVHYHYGSRHELARAVLERVLEPLQARRLELLDDVVARAEHEGRPPAVDALVTALVRPDLEAAVAVRDRNPAGAQIVGAIYTRPSAFVKSLVEESFTPVARCFGPHFATALPALEPEELSWRIRWGLFGILGAVLADDEATITEETLEAELARIVAMVVGGLRSTAGRSTAGQREKS